MLMRVKASEIDLDAHQLDMPAIDGDLASIQTEPGAEFDVRGWAEARQAADAVMGRLWKAPPPLATNCNVSAAANNNATGLAAVTTALKGVGNNQTASVVPSSQTVEVVVEEAEVVEVHVAAAAHQLEDIMETDLEVVVEVELAAAGHQLEDITETDLVLVQVEGDLALELPQGGDTKPPLPPRPKQRFPPLKVKSLADALAVLQEGAWLFFPASSPPSSHQ
eukprot:gene22243-29313_t